MNIYNLQTIARLSNEMIEFQEEIDKIKTTLKHAQTAWEDGDDPCAMADCDPGIQYELCEQIDQLAKARDELLDELHDALRDLPERPAPVVRR